MVRINTTYESAIYAWLVNATSQTVVWAEQDVNRPSRPYVSANITSYGISEGFPARSSDGDDNFTKHLKKLLNVSVGTYGETSAIIIDNVVNSVYNDTEIGLLKTAGLYFRTISDPIPLAQVIEGEWEQRWSVDVTFAYATDITSDVGYIDRVSGTILTNEFDTNNY